MRKIHPTGHRRLPPFAAVRAFEAAARHLNFTTAASELCVTPSAVSHQIAALEAYLGTRLFRRSGNRLALTPPGETYCNRLGTLLDGLEESTRAAQASAAPLRVLCTPGFAARWLVPRLSRLPGGDSLQLRVSVGAPSTDFRTNDADVVIHWSDAPVPGCVVLPLMQSVRYPAAAPGWVDRTGAGHPRDLLKARLLHDDVQDAWHDWFAAAGVVPPARRLGPSFPNCEMATTAAEAGQGVTLAYDAVAGEAVRRGSLVRLFDTVTLPITIYSVAYPKDCADDVRIRSFCDGLFSAAAEQGSVVDAQRRKEARVGL